MPSAIYYRHQARLLAEWAQLLRATDPRMSARLEVRAQEYLLWAAEAELFEKPTPDDLLGKALNAFNEQQMGVRPTPVTQQQQQIQPVDKDDTTP